MASMKSANRLLQALLTGSKTAWGAWQMLPGHNLSRTIARVGFDFVTVDCEHGNIDDSAMHESVMAIATAGSSPVVRVPANEGWMFKRALDCGAHAVMVPLVNTPEDARKVVSACKFPPVGIRGFGSPFPMAAFGTESTLEYLQQANDTLVTIVQIETKEGLSNIQEIAAVPGVDVLFIGPFDLGISIGHPITSSTMASPLIAAIEKIRDAAKKAGKCSGIYCTSGEQARRFAQEGFNMVSVGGDMIALGAHLGKALGDAKGESDKEIKTVGPYGK